MQQPETIGRFKVTAVLGRGAMGGVYLAEDPVLGREVAVKTIRLHPGLSEGDVAELRQRFENEARSAARLSHPNLMTIFDAGLHDESLYIAMEYVRGEGLDEIIASERVLTYKELADLVLQLGGALDYAHSQGIVHRDIKPANIIVNRRGQPKITDFGVAREATSTLTTTGMIIGTPAYMSPEQVTGHPVTGASDQFSLAIVVYELLTGRKPFSGEGATTILYKIVHEQPESANAIRKSLPAAIDKILARALSKAPEGRYPDCLSFAEAVRDTLGAAPAAESVRLASTVKRESAPSAKVVASPDAATQLQRPAQAGAVPASAGASADARTSANADSARSISPTMIGAMIVGVGVVLALVLLILSWRGDSSDTSLDSALQQGSVAGPVEVGTESGQLPTSSVAESESQLAVPTSDEGQAAAPPVAAPVVYQIVSRPVGAQVTLDGEVLPSVTPLDVPLAADERHTVLVELPGYQSVSWAFTPSTLSEEQQQSGRLFFPLMAEDAAASAGANEPVPESTIPAAALDPIQVRGRVQAPRVLHRVEPRLPAWAAEQGLPSYVIVELVVDRTGIVREARVLRAVNPILEKMALDAVRRWRFEPATRDGMAVDVRHNVSVTFRGP